MHLLHIYGSPLDINNRCSIMVTEFRLVFGAKLKSVCATESNINLSDRMLRCGGRQSLAISALLGLAQLFCNFLQHCLRY